MSFILLTFSIVTLVITTGSPSLHHNISEFHTREAGGDGGGDERV